MRCDARTVKHSDISCLVGNTFIVSDQQGDAAPDADRVLGAFFRDMRHLSKWQLAVDGRSLERLSCDTVGYRAATFFLAAQGGSVYDNPTVSVIRSRELGRTGGQDLSEDFRVTNSGLDEVVVDVSIWFDADFADVFEVKDKELSKKGRVTRRVFSDRVVLTYRRKSFVRETTVYAQGAMLSQGSVAFTVRLAPGAEWCTTVRVTFSATSNGVVTNHTTERHSSTTGETGRQDGYEHGADLDAWLAETPTLDTGSDDLRHTYERSLRDLAALRLHPQTLPEQSMLPAAGLPWFMAIFGRDSLITSYQALPYAPQLAKATLQALARRQAHDRDDFRDAEPGKILHELRFGELTHFHEKPQSPYYGSADSTPLFLILLDEYERWSGDEALVRELEPHARAALTWIEESGDLDGDGYIEYQRRNTTSGLVNQCWKDSWNSIVHPDGTMASEPRATCELQGYAYDARLRAARLAREIWQDPELADRLEQQAKDLQRRFNDDFWLDGPGFFALALDGEKQPVPTLTSNMGQLLWSGIVEESRVDSVVRHLMAESLYSGWGVRTLSSQHGIYNPIGYHIGTVWPHDNALIAAGLARYGRHEEAGRIAACMLAAAPHFHHRLPEVFAGFPRSLTRYPVEYPTACSPQAWAAGTPLLLLRVLLGMEPSPRRLGTNPHVPKAFGHVHLSGVLGRWGRANASSDDRPSS
jgi:glycogen debranching enzyme